MASLNEISYSIFEKLRPEISDDDSVSLEQLKFDINNFRAQFIRNELNRLRSVDSDITQTICLDLEKVDPSSCCDIEIECNFLLRSTKPIPDAIELHNKPGITWVGPVDKTLRPFSLIDYNRVPWVGNGRFNKNNVYTFLYDDHLYIMCNDRYSMSLSNAVVRGVFENPEEAAKFTDCSTGKPCYSDDDDYPVKAWMIPSIEAAVFDRYVRAIQMPEDSSNNADSDPRPNA
jgi:hypothetical protein